MSIRNEPPRKDTWQSFTEVDALLAELRGDHKALIGILQTMDIGELAAFGQRLYTLNEIIGNVAVAKARGLV